MTFKFPAIHAIEEKIDNNPIRQLVLPSKSYEVAPHKYEKNQINGCVLTEVGNDSNKVLVVFDLIRLPKEFDRILHVKSNDKSIETLRKEDIVKAKWLKHPQLSDVLEKPIDYEQRLESVLKSWRNAFSYIEENYSESVKGLRPPQTGAVHAIHAHWSLSDSVATVVMPTGTGKTETMLSALVSKRCEKLLVVVPTDALRTQISNKFLSLGVLRDLGDSSQSLKVISDNALYPVVGTLYRKPKNLFEVDEFFEKCNVVVTTMSIAGQCLPEVQERIAIHCPYLFIDEAHHIGASTWKEVRNKFSTRRIVQFTATPFREDDQPVGEKIIFNYPLKKAQEEGYFKPINFQPVVEFDPKKSDEAIAEKAVAQLRKDRKKYNHILMARAGNVKRARDIFKLYERYKEFNPVQIHTGITSKKERERVRQKIITGEAKIVVCVDMLGEGFDLPELKIAAFHDIRKSLAITLQLAGRFTRARDNLGDATFIANIADINVSQELQKLYAQDPDWNVLLREMSTNVIQEQINLSDFIEGFKNFTEDIPLQNVRPAMSTVIYRTKCKDWQPENFEKGIRGTSSLERIDYDVNREKRTLIIVTAKKVPIKWVKLNDIFNWDWELYIIYWDKTQKLLFIHSSNNSGFYGELAKAIAGDNVELISGGSVFRCLSGVNRLKLQNVGLIEQLAKLVRYTMRSGSDVGSGLTEAQKQSVVKANIFGSGYEYGARTSVGCSYKGRIWSRRKTNIEALTKWCSAIGKKVIDESINPDKVLEGTLIPESISERPRLIPISIEWSVEIYNQPETVFELISDEAGAFPLYEVGIGLKAPSVDGELLFEVYSSSVRIELKLNLFEKDGVKDYNFSIIGNKAVWMRYRSREIELSKFFKEYPPTIWFSDGSSLEGNQFIKLRRDYDPYPRNKIQDWDWTGIELKKEAQGTGKDANSIQYHVIRKLKEQAYEVIYDDDGAGESADVVAIKTVDQRVEVEFYHCKYSKEETPGARIGDLYEVCGQAQKSIHWKEDMPELFSHLLRREPKKKDGSESSRYEVGTKDDLFKLREMSRLLPVELKIYIVQPGLSKSGASEDQLELLSVTENHLMETYKLPLTVIASP